MADWFYGKDNTQHGPISELEIRALITSGTITPTTIVWREGMTGWLPMKDVPEFSTASSPSGISDPNAPTPYTSPQTNAALPPYQGAAIPTDGLSIASLVCGILAIISCYIWGIFGLPAVICGHMSLKKIKNSPTPVAGKGMAIAGLVCGYIGIALQLLVIIAFVAVAVNAASHQQAL